MFGFQNELLTLFGRSVGMGVRDGVAIMVSTYKIILGALECKKPVVFLRAHA